MQQLEIDYFYPLTEQILLGLDFKPCLDYEENKRKESLYVGNRIDYWNTGSANITCAQSPMSSFVVKHSTKNVGKWEITSGMFVYIPTKPNAVIRFMARYFFGFKWHDEI